MEKINASVADEPVKRSRGRRLFIAAAFFIFLIIIVVVIILIRGNTPSMSGTALLKAIDSYEDKGNYNKAISLIEHSKDESTYGKQRLLTSVYIDDHQYSKALTIYAGLKSSNQMTDADAAAAGATAASNDQSSLAASYYKLAAKLTADDHSNPVAKAEAAYDLNQALMESKK